MPFNRENLTSWLGSAGAGSATVEQVDPSRVLAHQVFEQELNGEADDTWMELLVSVADTEGETAALRQVVHQSMDWFTNRTPVFGSLTERYRQLNALALRRGVQVAPQVLGECIATYRLLLGRDPDDSGFFGFVDDRRTESLPRIVGNYIGAAETIAAFAPHDPPPVGIVAQLVVSASLAIVHAAGTDTSLGVILRVRDQIEALDHRLDRLERSVTELATYVRLRLDASANR